MPRNWGGFGKKGAASRRRLEGGWGREYGGEDIQLVSGAAMRADRGSRLSIKQRLDSVQRSSKWKSSNLIPSFRKFQRGRGGKLQEGSAIVFSLDREEREAETKKIDST